MADHLLRNIPLSRFFITVTIMIIVGFVFTIICGILLYQNFFYIKKDLRDSIVRELNQSMIPYRTRWNN